MASSGHGVLPAGIILTGGASQLAGMAELGREIFEMPVRVAAPSGVGGLVDNLLTPVYSTSVGLLITPLTVQFSSTFWAWGTSSLGSVSTNSLRSPTTKARGLLTPPLVMTRTS